jgi:hypothetical protein
MTTTYQEQLAFLDDHGAYTLFLTGTGAYEGSYRIDRCTGSDIKHNHHLLGSFRKAEIYPEPPLTEVEQSRAAEAAIPHRIEHSIKERYHEIYGDAGLKGLVFEVMRVTVDGRYQQREVDGAVLSHGLKDLVRTSRTLTIVQKGSRAEHLLLATLASTGEIRIHPDELSFSDLTPGEKAMYAIEEPEDNIAEDFAPTEADSEEPVEPGGPPRRPAR